MSTDPVYCTKATMAGSNTALAVLSSIETPDVTIGAVYTPPNSLRSVNHMTIVK